MKNKRLFRYLGAALVLLPFIGIYQYMKDIIYIAAGVFLLLKARAPKQISKSDRDNSVEAAENKSFPKIAIAEDANK